MQRFTDVGVLIVGIQSLVIAFFLPVLSQTARPSLGALFVRLCTNAARWQTDRQTAAFLVEIPDQTSVVDGTRRRTK